MKSGADNISEWRWDFACFSRSGGPSREGHYGKMIMPMSHSRHDDAANFTIMVLSASDPYFSDFEKVFSHIYHS